MRDWKKGLQQTGMPKVLQTGPLTHDCYANCQVKHWLMMCRKLHFFSSIVLKDLKSLSIASSSLGYRVSSLTWPIYKPMYTLCLTWLFCSLNLSLWTPLLQRVLYVPKETSLTKSLPLYQWHSCKRSYFLCFTSSNEHSKWGTFPYTIP